MLALLVPLYFVCQEVSQKSLFYSGLKVFHVKGIKWHHKEIKKANNNCVPRLLSKKKYFYGPHRFL